jgi:two-component system, cell cycle response regulator
MNRISLLLKWTLACLTIVRGHLMSGEFYVDSTELISPTKVLGKVPCAQANNLLSVPSMPIAGSSEVIGTKSRGWLPLGGAHPRVLLADDDEAVCCLLSRILRQWGYQVVIAKDGAEAWRILEQDGSPELVIMDWMMPEIDGLEIARRLRHERSDFYHYILLITGKSDKQDVVRALEVGADDYLTKPFDINELKSRLTVATRILSLQDDLIKAREGFRDQATKDGLTGIWNRAALLSLFSGELDRAARAKTMTGLLILDLDHFKRVNDTHGHLAGDFVLKEVAGRLKGALRSYDFLGRYGGEEFLIALPSTSRNQVCEIAERIRLSMSVQPVLFGNAEIPISVSVGAVEVRPGEMSSLNAVALADIALYHAKRCGRDRAVNCRRSWQELLQSEGNHEKFCNECICSSAMPCTMTAEKPNAILAKKLEPCIIFPFQTGRASRTADFKM